MNSLNPNGTPVQCIPVPAPLNLAPLEMAIVQESAERKQADADLRASINQTKIAGSGSRCRRLPWHLVHDGLSNL